MDVSKRRMERLAARNQAECGFRVVAGDHVGLSARWRHGLVTLSKGEILFRPFMPPGIRILRPFTKPVVIPIVSMDEAGRRPSGAETWSVNLETEVLCVNTGQAELEWAVLMAQREWVLQAVS
jgi:hypothetical protein